MRSGSLCRERARQRLGVRHRPVEAFCDTRMVGSLAVSAGERPVYIPDSVERELNDAAEHVSAARAVLDAGWIHVHRSTSRDFGEAFAHYADRLVVGDKNLGECGVLAMGQIYSTSAKW